MNQPPLEILVVDDEAAAREWLERAFAGAGHRVTGAANATTALELAGEQVFDVVLLDVDLGAGLNGYEICQAMRARANMVPIIMLTGKRAEVNAVRGLEAGADDYVTKPFGFAELSSRVRAVLRRTGMRSSVREAGPLRMDLQRREVTMRGATVQLTVSEFRLLAALLERPGVVRSRQELMTAIWGDSAYRELRGIDVHVRHLRQKIGDDTILTVRGGGYRLADA